ncbi:polysaccharide deacetylase family protein [bacterium]|nr:polysaccharide deacetylase family protein [bacterium]
MKKGLIIICLSLILVVIQQQKSPAADHIVILQYHHFGSETPPSTSVTLEQFDQHLRYLEKNNFQVWDLEKSLSYIRDGIALPENCVAITIDDAYRSIYSEAYPRLKKRNWPFTVFVASEGVDQRHSIYMTWEQMREMKQAGVTFAAHSHSHPYLVRQNRNESQLQWKKRVIDEIKVSRQRLKEELGAESKLFAYPYGEYNSEIKQIVLEMGLIGIGQHSGSVWPGSDFGALPRFPMSGEYASLGSFMEKVNSLPLPVMKIDPENPVLEARDFEPTLRIELAKGDYPLNLNSLSCFASGQGRMELNWIDRKNLVFAIQALKPLPLGRSRYNCTARHLKANRYYWFSQQWIKLE